MKRALTGTALAVVALAAVFAPWPPVFALLLVIVGMLAVRELYDLAEASNLRPYRYVGFVATTVLVLRMALPWEDIVSGSGLGLIGLDKIVFGCLLAVLLRALSLPERMETALADASATLFAMLYPAALIGLLGEVRRYGAPWLVFLFAVVWIGDVAALYAGRAFGRRPMAERVSPQKTWEGAIASALAALITGCLLGLNFGMEAGLNALPRFAVIAALSLALNAAAQIGDLVESLFKRGAQIKDSGTLLPGHGGVLDRMDALLLAAPVLWYYLNFRN